MVSAQPLIAVSGVLSSCETVDIKSFFMVSVLDMASAMVFTVLPSSLISSFVSSVSTLAVKSPSAILRAVRLITLTGRTIDLIKKIPESATSARAIRTTTTIITVYTDSR